jgi:hypothetical protein
MGTRSGASRARTAAQRASRSPFRIGGGSFAGLRFDRSPSDRSSGNVLLRVSTARLEASWRRDTSYHIGPGGSGPSAKPGAYGNARDYLTRAHADGRAVHAPSVSLDRRGNVSVGDGRHRLAVLRDSGASTVVVSVRRYQAERVRKLFGAGD